MEGGGSCIMVIIAIVSFGQLSLLRFCEDALGCVHHLTSTPIPKCLDRLEEPSPFPPAGIFPAHTWRQGAASGFLLVPNCSQSTL